MGSRDLPWPSVALAVLALSLLETQAGQARGGVLQILLPRINSVSKASTYGKHRIFLSPVSHAHFRLRGGNVDPAEANQGAPGDSEANNEQEGPELPGAEERDIWEDDDSVVFLNSDERVVGDEWEDVPEGYRPPDDMQMTAMSDRQEKDAAGDAEHAEGDDYDNMASALREKHDDSFVRFAHRDSVYSVAFRYVRLV
jgi:hypothetical protein